MTRRIYTPQTGAEIGLLDIHAALSTLIFAVKEELDPFIVDVQLRYRDSTYLCVVIECRERHKQAIIDRLAHGVLWGPYDYRFQLSYSTIPVGDHDWTFIEAYPNMHWDQKKFEKAA